MATQTWNSSGSYQWVCPAGVTSVKAECWGGGAGGQWASGPGGGGGEYATEATVAVTPGNSYNVTVGAGGNGGTVSNGHGQPGGSSTFTGNSLTVTAHGAPINTTSPTTGGSGSTNTTHHSGGGCTDTGGTSDGGGGGGGSGGSAAAGNAGTAHSGTTGGAGATAVTGGGAGGHGGNGGSSSTAGSAGGSPGGGGGSGGSTASAGSNGGGGAAGQVALTYTATVTMTGSMSLTGMRMASTESAGNVVTSSFGLSEMGMAAAVFQDVPFPVSTLNITVEILVNGTWTNVTSYVYQRNDISISGRGRPDETTQVQPAELTLTLDGRDGSFTPSYTGGQFYPYIGRNTQIRVSVADQSEGGTVYQGYRFWGEVSAWPPQWDVTGSDIYVSITAGGVLRRYVQGGNIGSPVKRFYLLKTDATAPVALWTMEDLNGSTQFVSALQSGFPMAWTGTPQLSSDTSFSGTDPLPLLNGAELSGLTGSYSSAGPDTYSTPGTYQWTCPGGVASVAAECWGAGGGGSNGYQNNGTGSGGGGGGEYAKEPSVLVTPGNQYTVTVGTGGPGGILAVFPTVDHSGSSGAGSSFTGDSLTVTAHPGGGGGQSVTYPAGKGAGGTGSTNATHENGGTGGQGDSGGDFGGSGGGSSGGSAAAGNNGANGGTSNSGAAGGAAVTGGGSGGAGGAGGSGVDKGGVTGTVPGGGGGAGGQNSENGAAHGGGNGASGRVKISYTSSTTPNNVVVRFALSVPSTDAVNGAVLVHAIMASGSLTYIEAYYGTGGTIGFRGYNGATKEFDSGALAFGAVATPMIVSMELMTSGANIAWKIQAATPGAASPITPAGNTGTYSTATIGAVSEITVNPAGTILDTAIGIVVLQYALEDLITSGLADALNGHAGELAGTRFTRLCSEAGIGGIIRGSTLDTPQMGPQRNDKFSSVLQTVEDADQGIIIEARDMLGLYYRTRCDLSNQSAVQTFDYSQAVFAQELNPTPDDALTRNDVTVTRINGASATVQELSGPLSMQDPPNGVGDYQYSLNATLDNDTQVQPLATFVEAKGTVSEQRYPAVIFDLTRSEVAGLFAGIPALDGGDHFQMISLPSYGDVSTADQLAWGFEETLNAFKWTIELNAVPSLPYETALNSDILRDTSSPGNWTAGNGTFSVAAASVAPAGAPYAYAGEYVNNGTAGYLYDDGMFSALPSTVYRLDFWAYSTVTSLQVGWDWYDVNSSYLSTTVATITVTANTWTKLSTTETSDPSAAAGITRIGSASLGYTLWVQAVVVMLPTGMW